MALEFFWCQVTETDSTCLYPKAMNLYSRYSLEDTALHSRYIQPWVVWIPGAGLRCLAVGKTEAARQNPRSSPLLLCVMCSQGSWLVLIRSASSEPLSSGRQNVAASNSQLDVSMLSTPDGPNLPLPQFHIPREGGLISLSCVMVL